MKYSLIMQHTTSKKAYDYLLDDSSTGKLYHKFDIQLDTGMQDGEYEYLLCYNEKGDEVSIDINDIRKSTIDGKPIDIESFGLMQIGDFNTGKPVYDKTQEFLTYEG